MINVKCKLRDDGFFEWCTAMKKMLHPEENSLEKGLVQVNIFSLESAKESCLGVQYRDSHLTTANKIMLNKCPWCGENILNYSKIKTLQIISQVTNSKDDEEEVKPK